MTQRIALASAIAAVIVALAVLVTPNLLFERFIVATGLPEVVAGAAPPLGIKARIAFALLAAILVAGISFAALYAAVVRKGVTFTRTPKSRTEEDEFFAYVPPAPRRKLDSHPDSPPRPPIKAGDDLGTPLDLVDVVVEEDDAVGDAWAMPEAAVESAISEEEAIAFETPEEPIEKDDYAAFEMSGNEADDEDFDSGIEIPAPTLSAYEAFDPPADDDPAPRESAEEPAADDVPLKGELADLVARLEAGIDRRRSGQPANDAEGDSVTAHPTAAPGREQELRGALSDALDALHRLNAGGSR